MKEDERPFNAGDEGQQVVFISPELLQAARQRQAQREGNLAALRAAADSGDIAAVLMLAGHYLYTEEDPVRAAELYVRAAEAGNAEAQCVLGELFHDGCGVGQDSEKAVEMFERAAAQGHDRAMVHLGYHCLHGIGTARDPAKAYSLYSAAAAAGNVDAHRALGVLCENGVGTAQDIQLAIKHFTAAAAMGDVESGYYLAGIYSEEGETENPPLAADLFRIGAEVGHAPSQYRYALCLANGYGVEKDMPAARDWLEQADAQDFPPASNILGRLYERGDLGGKDRARAAEYYKRSFSLGQTNAALDLGNMIYANDGRPRRTRDVIEAVEWYRRASERGNGRARTLLAQFEKEARAARVTSLLSGGFFGVLLFFYGLLVLANEGFKAYILFYSVGFATIGVLCLQPYFLYARMNRARRSKAARRTSFVLGCFFACLYFIAVLTAIYRSEFRAPAIWIALWTAAFAVLGFVRSRAVREKQAQ